MSPDPMVHVLIPVHNRLAHTRKCLACLARQTYSRLGVTVIDDGSTDGTSEAIAAEFPKVRMLHGDGSWWWTGSMSRGVEEVLARAASDDLILCINDDTTFDDDYVSTLVGLSLQRPGAIIGSLLRSSVDQSVIGIGPRIVWRKGFVYDLLWKADSLDDLLRQETIEGLDALPGRGTLIPVRVFREIGNFRRRALPHYAADYEFAARAKARGVPLVLSTHAAVYTAPDAPRQTTRPGMVKPLRALFSRRSNTNVIDHVVLFSVVGPVRTRPLAVAHVLYGAYRFMRNAIASWIIGRDVTTLRKPRAQAK